MNSKGYRFFCVTLVTVLGAICALPLAAQSTGQIEGTVTEAVTARPVDGVRVQIVGTTLLTTSGQDGRDRKSVV